MSEHALYRFYDDGGQLLYVGITDDPGRRFAQHAAKKIWWRQVRGISIDWYEDRESVKAAERRIINIESPIYNVQRAHPRPPEPKRCGHCWNCTTGLPCIFHGGLDPDDDPVICPQCDRSNCMFGLGWEIGTQHGFSAAYDHFVREPRRRRYGLV